MSTGFEVDNKMTLTGALVEGLSLCDLDLEVHGVFPCNPLESVARAPSSSLVSTVLSSSVLASSAESSSYSSELLSYSDSDSECW
jgi:hypothetical protein